MIIRITNKVEGIVRYLLTGTKNDRDIKDHRIPVWGDLSLTNHAINYLKKTRKYKKNYMHITASFSESDEHHLKKLSDEERFKRYQILVNKILTSYFPNRSMEEDYMPYAELHAPTDTHQYNSENRRRLPHIHIVIPLLDLKTQNQLRAVPFSLPFNAAVQSSICDTMGFEDPIHKALKNTLDKTNSTKPISQAGDLSNKIAELINQTRLRTESELIKFVQSHPEISDVRIVSGKSGRYIKATTTVQKSTKRGGYHQINLRGERFPLVEQLLNPLIPRHTTKTYPSKKRTLKKISESRAIRHDIIQHATDSFCPSNKNHQPRNQNEKRRRLYLADLKQYLDELSRSQKQFYYIYKTNIDSELVKGSHIWNDKKNNITVITTPKIKILDHGDVLTSTSKDIHETALLMLEIGLKKGWELDSITASGSDEFIEEFERLKRLKITSRQNQMDKVEYAQVNQFIPEVENAAVDSELENIPINSDNDLNATPISKNRNTRKPMWKP